MPGGRIGSTLYDRAVLLDTGALVALTDRSDGSADEALECAHQIARESLPLFVALPTIIEAHRLVMFRCGRVRARAMVEALYDGSVNLIPVIVDDEVEARQNLDRYHWLDLSMADALNMAAAVRVGVRTIFSFDADYLHAGFIRVPPFYPWW